MDNVKDQQQSNAASTQSPPDIGRASSRPPALAMSPTEVEQALATAAEQARRAAQSGPAHIQPVMPPNPGKALPIGSIEEYERDRERRFREEKTAKLLQWARIPARYQNATVSPLDHLPERVREQYRLKSEALFSLAEQPVIIALSGNRGPGKTHMACALVRHFCQQQRMARYAVAMDYFTALKIEYGKPNGNESRIDDEFATPRLLVLDEIQVRGETDWENRMLTRLIDRRYSELRTTVLITNETGPRFIQTIGDSIANRIMDGGAIIECTWQSLRGALNG